jgi:O-antigen/teichoic acid export membrane protein
MSSFPVNAFEKVKNKLKNTPNHVYVAASAWVCNFTLAGLQLVIIPILSTALGADAYAAFVIMTSLVLWFNLSDFSLGYSLQNYISEQRAKKEPYDNYIFNAIFLVLLILAGLLTFFYFMSPTLGNILLQQFDFLSATEKTKIFFTVVACFVFTGVSAVGYKIWFAEHKGYFSNSLPALGMVISFALIFLYIDKLEHDKLFWALFIYVFPGAILGTIVLLSRFVNTIKKGAKLRLDIIKPLSKRAFSFWGFVFMGAIVLQVDYIIMSQTLDPKEIITYNITFRIFNMLFIIYNAILAALWPVFAEAVVANKWRKVKVYLKKYLIQGISLMALITTVMCFLMPVFARILVPSEKIVVPVLFIVALGVYFIFRIWTDTFAMVLNSMSKLWVFWAYIPVQAVISAFCQWHFSKAIGIYGIPLGIITSFVLTASWILPFMVFKYMKRYKTNPKGA